MKTHFLNLKQSMNKQSMDNLSMDNLSMDKQSMDNLSMDNLSMDNLSLRYPYAIRIVHHLRRMAAVMLCLLTLGVGEIWGNNTSATFYLAIDADKTKNNGNCCNAQFQIKYGSNDSEWSAWTTMTKYSKTYNGKIVYQATYQFPYDGYYNWQWRMEENNNQHWYYSAYANGWNTDRHNGQLYDYENQSWVTPSWDASYTVYFVNTNNWTKPTAYAFNGDCDNNASWSGTVMTSVGKNYNGKSIYKIDLDKRYAYIIFSNEGSSQTANLTLGSTNTGKMYDNGTWKTYNYDITVTYNANGHGTAPSSQIILKGGKATEPAAPTASGWTFGGWYEESGCTNAWNFSNTISDNKTLYAKWTQEPGVTLAAAKNTGINVGETVILTATGSNASSITKYEFYEGDTKKGEVSTTATTATYDYIPTTTGNKTVKVKMTYNSGSNNVTSSTVSLTLNTPSVSLAVKSGSSSEIYLSESTTILKATASNVGAGVTPSYVFTDQASPAVSSSSQTSNEWTYTPSATGTKTMKVTMTVGGSEYTAMTTVKVYEHWNIYVHDVSSWGSMYLYLYDNSTSTPKKAWPGDACTKLTGTDSWYKVTLDSKYPHYILDNNNSNQLEGRGQVEVNKTTYPADTYWYTNFRYTGSYGDDNGKNIYELKQITLSNPTVGAPTLVKATSGQLTLKGQVTNCGGDGSTAADMKEVGFKIGDTKYKASCTDGVYFYKTITGLTAATAYSVTAYAENIKGTGTSTAASHSTTASSTYTIKVQIPKDNAVPKIYAWTDADACGEGKLENAAFNSAPEMTLDLTTESYKWYKYELNTDYDNFLFYNTGNSDQKSANLTAPKEDKCYWFNNGGDSWQAGTMECPHTTPQLMIESTAGSGSFAYNEMTTSEDKITKTIHLAAEVTYKFKVVYNTDYYSNSSNVITGSNYNDIQFSVEVGDNTNTQIKTTVEGDYTFSFNTTSKKLTVTYPDIPTATPTLTDNSTVWVKTTGDGNTNVGSGTESNPYLIFAGENLNFTTTFASTPSATDHLYVVYTKSGTEQTEKAYSSRTITINTSASDVSNSVKYISVKAYYKYNSIQGTKTESGKIYYKVIAAPTISLTMPQENGQPAAYLKSSFAITTTATNISATGISAAQYEYTYHRTSNSTEKSARAYDTSVATSLDLSAAETDHPDYYTITVNMKYGGKIFSASANINLYLIYYVTIYDPRTDVTNIYAWGGGEANNKAWPGQDKAECTELLMTDFVQNNVTYNVYGFEFKHPLWTNMQINGGNDTKKTGEIEIKGNTCIYLNKSNWNFTKTDNCSLVFYRVKSKVGDNVYYSNISNTNDDILSYFASKDGSARLEKLGTSGWENATANFLTNPSESGVYTAVLNTENSTLSNIQKYEGDFYLFGNCERANETNDGVTTVHHKAISGSFQSATEEDKERAKFTPFNPDRTKSGEYYNHYWVEWLSKGQDIRATVGNDYNSNLATYIGADRYTTAQGLIPDDMPHENEGQIGYNVRFAYDNTTNVFERTVIQGSTNSTKHTYLTMYASADKPIYKNATGSTSSDIYLEAAPAYFTDASNWVYQTDAYVDNQSEVVVKALIKRDGSGEAYGSSYPLGTVDVVPKAVRILSDASTANQRWNTRLIYDYKTNKIVVGWLVAENENITQNLVLDGNMMIQRKEKATSSNWNAAATISQLTLNSVKVEKVQNVYTVLELGPNNWNNSGGYGVFWLSLPYRCYVNDIFGLDHYSNDGYLNGSSKKWFVTKYRGDLRAQMGWWKDIPSFWESLWQNYKQADGTISDEYIEANEGFCLMVKLTDGDFPSIGEGASAVQLLRFFFPSRNAEGTYFDLSTSTVVEQYESMLYDKTKHAQTEDRTKDDSNWRCFGVPGYKSMTVSATAAEGFSDYALDATKYFYNYDFTKAGSIGTSGTTASARYVATAMSDYTFKPTYGYMMQFAGKLTWTNASSSAVRSIAARKEEAKANRLLEIRLTPANQEQTEDTDYTSFSDRTYLNLLDQATADYDLSLDLMKIINSTDNIYTYSPAASTEAERQMQYAANNLPLKDQKVPLAVMAQTDGEFIISIENRKQLNGITVVLNDKEQNKRIPLNSADYTVSLTKGTYEQRFELELVVTEPQEIQDEDDNTTTAVEDNSAYTLTQADGKLIVSGFSGTETLELYDTTGKQLLRRQVQSGDYISVPTNAIYLIRLAGKTERVYMR